MNISTVHRAFLLCSTMTGLLVLAGCDEPEPPRRELPVVTVTRPIQRDVVDYIDFTGTVQTTEFVEIRARVPGFLERVREFTAERTEEFPDGPIDDFKEGTIVKKGDLLFVIEPEPYEAEMEVADARKAQAESGMQLAKANFGRAERLFQQQTIPLEEYETKRAELEVARAQVLSADASIRQTKIDVDYTRIHAPFDGLISRRYVDPGNLVGATDKTLLTTIVKMDPMHVYFDVSERVVLRYLEWQRERTDGEREEASGIVHVGLANEEGFPHQGIADFIDNRVDSTTGTALIRAVFPNQEGHLYPGLFVRIRIPSEPLDGAILVKERAVGTDLSGKFLLVIDAENVVEQRSVELGPLFDDLRVIHSGIEPDEQYIVNGLQRARPGLPVNPETESPAPSPAASDEPAE